MIACSRHLRETLRFVLHQPAVDGRRRFGILFRQHGEICGLGQGLPVKFLRLIFLGHADLTHQESGPALIAFGVPSVIVLDLLRSHTHFFEFERLRLVFEHEQVVEYLDAAFAAFKSRLVLVGPLRVGLLVLLFERASNLVVGGLNVVFARLLYDQLPLDEFVQQLAALLIVFFLALLALLGEVRQARFDEAFEGRLARRLPVDVGYYRRVVILRFRIPRIR